MDKYFDPKFICLYKQNSRQRKPLYREQSHWSNMCPLYGGPTVPWWIGRRSKALARRSNNVYQTFEICLSSKMFDRLATSKKLVCQHCLFVSSKCFGRGQTVKHFAWQANVVSTMFYRLARALQTLGRFQVKNSKLNFMSHKAKQQARTAAKKRQKAKTFN